MSDSDDDNVPILKSKKRKAIIQEDSDEDDDVPLSKIKKEKEGATAAAAGSATKVKAEGSTEPQAAAVVAAASATNKVFKNDESSSRDEDGKSEQQSNGNRQAVANGEDSDEEDLPLSQLKRRAEEKASQESSDKAKDKAARKAAKAAAAVAAAGGGGGGRKEKKEKGNGGSSSSAPAQKLSLEGSGGAVTTKADVTSSSVEMYKLVKGEMVQKLLCRWWYAVDWPMAKDIIDPPSEEEGFVELDGFKGVYVCITGSDDHEIGTLKDCRNKKTCPCYATLIRKDTAALKELLHLSLLNQKKQLKEVWIGSGRAEEKAAEDELLRVNAELKWLAKVDLAKAEKQASKLLKKLRHKR